jgi:flagellar hook protein FlgE
MYSGISGMKNFQTKLDVIGNNIANVNTYGFKKGRVTFKETMNQMISGATAATENRGGKNAMQVGLGSTIATIDTIHTGSSLQTTGRSLDLGIDGDGYFVVRQGDAMVYTRAGNFYLDDNGTLVNSDGLNVQAFKYDDTGNLTNEFGDVVINVNAVLPGVETTSIKFSENLAANATVGSIFSQQIKVVDSQGNSVPTTVYFKKLANDNWGVYVNEVPKQSEAVPTSKGTTAGKITITNPGKFSGTDDSKWELKHTTTPGEFTLGGTTKVLIINNGVLESKETDKTNANYVDLQGLNIDVSSLFKDATAKSTQKSGNSGNLEITDPKTYSDTSFTGNIIITYDTSSGSGVYKYYKEGDNPATAPTFTPGTGSSVFGLEIKTPTVFNPNNGDTWSIAVTPKVSPSNTDAWDIDIKAATKPMHELNFMNGQIPTNSAKIPFNLNVPTGKVDDANTVADESTQELKNIQLDFSNLTQLEGTTTAVVDPNGNAEGKLESFNIGSLGEINGVYSNGEIVTIGQLALAKFSNSSGLTKTGNNLFQESINSGTPDINVAGEGRGTLASGSLEMSNVDLSEEFTEMITAQRGFQANTRIITTSDEILQELVNLKR